MEAEVKGKKVENNCAEALTLRCKTGWRAAAASNERAPFFSVECVWADLEIGENA